MDKDRAIHIHRAFSGRLIKKTKNCVGCAVLWRDGEPKMSIILTKKNSSHEHLVKMRFGKKARIPQNDKSDVSLKRTEEDLNGELATDLIEVGEKGIVPYWEWGSGDYTARWRPCPAAVSLGHVDISAGTAGGMVYKNGKKYILTNNHVAANQNEAEIGDHILQPGPYDGGIDPDDMIGTLAEFVPIEFITDAGMPENEVDCALVEPLSGPDWKSGQSISEGDIRKGDTDLMYRCKSGHTSSPSNKPISGTNWADAWECVDIYDNILGNGLCGEPRDAYIGEIVCKSGRTTEWTTGYMWGFGDFIVCYEINEYGDCVKEALFIDQIVTGPMAGGGDSGSLLLGWCDKRPVGLLFAGGGGIVIYNRIGKIIEALGISFTPSKRIAITAGCFWQIGKSYISGNRVESFATYTPYVCIKNHISTSDDEPGNYYAPNWQEYWESCPWRVSYKTVEGQKKICSSCCCKIIKPPPQATCLCKNPPATIWHDGLPYDIGNKIVGDPDNWVIYDCFVGHISSPDRRPSSGADWKLYWKRWLNLMFLEVTVTGHQCCNPGCVISEYFSGDINGTYVVKMYDPSECHWSSEFPNDNPIIYEAYNTHDPPPCDVANCLPECLIARSYYPDIRVDVFLGWDMGVEIGVFDHKYPYETLLLFTATISWEDIVNCVECEGDNDRYPYISCGPPDYPGWAGGHVKVRARPELDAEADVVNPSILPPLLAKTNQPPLLPTTKKGCCGKALKGIADLMAAYSRAGITQTIEIVEKLFPTLGPDMSWVDGRKQICLTCDKLTWMSKAEYAKWLMANYEDIKDKLKKSDTLKEALLLMPPLLIQLQSEGHNEPFCSLCKCWLPAKWRDWTVKCPVDKWLNYPPPSPSGIPLGFRGLGPGNSLNSTGGTPVP